MFGFILTMLGLACMCGSVYCMGMIAGIRKGKKALQAVQSKTRIQTKAEIDRDLQEAWAEVEREFPTRNHSNGKV